MRLARLIGTSLLTGAAILGAAQPAPARDGPRVVTVAPSSGPLDTGRAGMTVRVYDGDLCGGTTATATSRAFAGVVSMSPGANMLVGTTTIAGATPATYAVRVHCDDKTYVGSVTVLGGGAEAGDGSSAGGSHDAASGLAIVAVGVGLGGLAFCRRRCG